MRSASTFADIHPVALKRLRQRALLGLAALVVAAVAAPSTKANAAGEKCEFEPLVTQALAAAKTWQDLYDGKAALLAQERERSTSLVHALETALNEVVEARQELGAALRASEHSADRVASGQAPAETDQARSNAPRISDDVGPVHGAEVRSQPSDDNPSHRSQNTDLVTSERARVETDLTGANASEMSQELVPMPAEDAQRLAARPDTEGINNKGVVPASEDSAKEGQKLVARADQLLQQGDISGARLLLERAVATGSARAAFILAETYDANVLPRWRTFGVRPRPERAQEFYKRALEGGIPEARARISSPEQTESGRYSEAVPQSQNKGGPR